MKKIVWFVLTGVLFAFCSSAQVLCIRCYNQNARVYSGTTNLIVNGGFETSPCMPYNGSTADSYCPKSSLYKCDIPNWLCTGGGVKTYACIIDTNWYTLSNIIEGTKAAYFGNNYSNSCSLNNADTSCLGKVGCQVTGIQAGYPYNSSDYGDSLGVSLTQTVTGLTPGLPYVLEFWAGGESPSSVFTYDGLFAVDVGFGNIFLRDPPTPPFAGIGRRYLISFTATASSHSIKFTNWGHCCGTVLPSCTELVLDDVRMFAGNPDNNICITEINAPVESRALTAFPNPVSDLFTVTTNTNEASEIILYDVVAGKLLQKAFTNTISISTENLSKGIYLYEVRDGNGSRFGRIIKE